MKITVEDMRAVVGFTATPGFCAKGMRRWFKAHGFDYDKFRKEGIDEEVLLKTGDPMAVAAVEQAHERR